MTMTTTRYAQVLDAYETGTEVWQKVLKRCEEELVVLRARLENPRATMEDRVMLAWQIDTYKKFMAFGHQPGDKKGAGAGE